MIKPFSLELYADNDNAKDLVIKWLESKGCTAWVNPDQYGIDLLFKNPEGDYYSCGAMGDDKEYPINFVKEVKEGGFITPLQNAPELFALKNECVTCPMFSICNGCKKTIKDLIRVTSKNFNIPEKNIRPILAQV